MQHDTTAPKHGKGKGDGIGSHLKSDADRAELKEIDEQGRSLMVLDAASMYEVERRRISVGVMYPDYTPAENAAIPAANSNDGSQEESAITRRKLYLFPAGYMDRTNLADFKTIEGTRIIYHSARGCGDKSKVLMRRFSCFCDSCVAHKYEECVTRELMAFGTRGLRATAMTG
jgi:hypothetical protein